MTAAKALLTNGVRLSTAQAAKAVGRDPSLLLKMISVGRILPPARDPFCNFYSWTEADLENVRQALAHDRRKKGNRRGDAPP